MKDLLNFFDKPKDPLSFTGIRISLASPTKIREWSFEHPQAVLEQFQIANHFRVQQADGIAGRGIAETRMKLFRHRRPADDLAALQHAHRPAPGGQVAGADQTVVAGANDQRIVGLIQFFTTPAIASAR